MRKHYKIQVKRYGPTDPAMERMKLHIEYRYHIIGELKYILRQIQDAVDDLVQLRGDITRLRII